mgnify:CR=1 FL=1
MKYYLLVVLAFLGAGCQLHDENGLEAVDKALTSWANAYFAYDYEEALKHLTPESEKWIRFAASNITEQDVRFINEHNKGVHIEITDHQPIIGDTACTARLRVTGYAQLGFTEQDNQVVDQADYQIALVMRDGEWLVKMEGPLQSGK